MRSGTPPIKPAQASTPSYEPVRRTINTHLQITSIQNLIEEYRLTIAEFIAEQHKNSVTYIITYLQDVFHQPAQRGVSFATLNLKPEEVTALLENLAEQGEIGKKLYCYLLPLDEWKMSTHDLLHLKSRENDTALMENTIIPHLDHALRIKCELFKHQFEKANELIQQSSLHINLEGATLEDMQLTKLDLNKVNFRRAKIKKVSFNESELFEADFQKATLFKVTFIKADLRCANMRVFEEESRPMQFLHDEYPYYSAWFDDANMALVDLSHTILTYMNFKGADLTNANLSRCAGMHNFDNAILNNTIFVRAYFRLDFQYFIDTQTGLQLSALDKLSSMIGANIINAEFEKAYPMSFLDKQIMLWINTLPANHFLKPIATQYSNTSLSIDEKKVILWLAGSKSPTQAISRINQYFADFNKNPNKNISRLFHRQPIFYTFLQDLIKSLQQPTPVQSQSVSSSTHQSRLCCM